MDEALEFHELTVYRPGRYSKGAGGREPEFIREFPTAPALQLPEPKGIEAPVGNVIVKRRSKRAFRKEALDLLSLSTLLFYTLGMTEQVDAYGMRGYPLRAAPSAGALNSVELYVAIFNVKNAKEGVYYYDYLNHRLSHLIEGDLRDAFRDISMGQDFVGDASSIFIFTALYERIRWRYGIRGYRYVHIDGGCAAENLYLVCEALGLGTVIIGAFYDTLLSNLLGLDTSKEFPLFFMPVGYVD